MPNNVANHSGKKIMGIDPGYDRLGIAIIEKPIQGREKIIYSGCFQTSASLDIYERLRQVGAEIKRLVEEFRPDFAALETLFITKNQKTAMHVSEARGIIVYELTKNNIPISEYSPMQIKVAVTGSGRSDKSNIIKMIHLLVHLPESFGGKNKKRLDDEYDAIAAALTHIANLGNKTRNIIHSLQRLQK